MLNPGKYLALKAIRVYQRFISPLLPPRCRYYPTCSQYCLEAVQIHGVCKGLALGLWRILRCNPLSKGGVDPVPGSELARRRAATQGSKSDFF